ncbi:Protein of unknown function [Enhydrobacter aerosaccus]|uniref:DUF2891 domain-containing protein n=1 Tax=Enhydrobacter aerosaccus TaxID=225324 RepID=A0A1T4JZS5_9HYPH|nr:DUF2891 domain-containing protein [Enhydrobacter aerosaccus]SJZ35671.1 Protein of unknown function [Enhydrobacter aerosaccus]
MSHTLTQELAEQFARIALRNVRREYPNNLDHALAGAADARTPGDLHPVFYGSYDWHSCVHNYWLLSYLLRRFPDFAPGADIRILFDSQFVPGKVAKESAYFATPTTRKFKRPYGWAWLLKLAAELSGHHRNPWARNLAPLTDTIVQLLRDFLPLATYPIRVGTHFNTAFSLRMAADYADVAQDRGLGALLLDTARRWYGADADCPAWGEPSLDDFQSSALIEAECMRRLLSADEFLPWFNRFLPHIAEGEPATLFRPATVSDRTDGKIAHLDGLNLSRAWCWRSIALELSLTDPRRSIAEEAADRHLKEGLPHIVGDYAGEHWLATFAVLALDVRA